MAESSPPPEEPLPSRALTWPTALGLVLLVLPVLVPLMTTHLPGGHDVLDYLPRLVEFHENVRHGILLPRWAPDLSSGHGQPLFLLAPPMVYYLGEIGLLLGLDPVVALNAACMFLVVVSAWAMFLLGHHLFGSRGGWLAAAAYVYAPYFHVDLFVRHALAEFAAFAFYPLALLGFARFARDGKKSFLLLGAAGYAGTVFSHFPAALLFSPFLAAFVVFQTWHDRSWRKLAAQAAGIALGLGLAACCWMPALAEMRYARLDALREGYAHYSNHFVSAGQFFSTAWGYGISVPGGGDGMPFTLGWSHLLLGALALALTWCKLRGHRALLEFFTGSAVTLSFLMTPASRWIWDRVTLLTYLEFPWRLLAPVTVCLAVLVAALGAALPESSPRSRIAFLAILALVILPNVDHIGVDRYFEIDLTGWTPEGIARRGTATTIRREYEPLWVEESPRFRRDDVVVVEGRARATAERPTPIAWTVDVDAETDALLELRCFDFPGWQLRLGGEDLNGEEGEDLDVERAPRTGRIRFRVPVGEHRVEARFRRTAVRWVGEGVSLVSVLIGLGLVFGPFAARRRASGVIEEKRPKLPTEDP